MKNTCCYRLFVGIEIFVCSILTTFGQAIPQQPLSEGPLEYRQDPPASIVPRQPKLAPRMVSPFGPFISYQVNVDFNHNNIIGDAANEPSICVDPNNPNRMAIGWRQFDSVSSNFRQAGWAFTSDGGVTWTFPGVLQSNVFRSDPVLNSDSSGQFYYLSLLENFYDDIWRSVDGGQSFINPAPATGGDKQWFTIDNTNSPGRGFQYQAWSTAGNNWGGRQFNRSTDGGVSWLPGGPVNIPHSPTWGTLDVDSNGILYIGGVNQTTGQIWCVRSSNARNAAVTPTFELGTPVNLGGNIGFSQNINPEGLVGQINLVVDRSGTGTNNFIYMLGSLRRFGFNAGSDILFVRSTDGGQTFSPPVRINDDPVNPNKWHWFGALAVAPNGRLDCVWLDTRNAANNTDSQLFYSYSSDGGLTWTPNIAVSNSFNPYLGYPNQNKIGDYITVVSDNNGASVAYSATFNGEEDVYYLRIPAAATAAFTISLSASPPEGGSVSGGGSYPLGSDATVTAFPNADYSFDSWTENGVVVSFSQTYNFIVGGDRALVANFVFAGPIAAAPVFSPAGGASAKKIKVKILDLTPGAVVFYTLDGTDPTFDSLVYVIPQKRKQKNPGITITGKGIHILKGIAWAPGFNTSPITTGIYSINR